MARAGSLRPDVSTLTDNRVAVDFGAPGPFLVLTPRQIRGLVFALADAGWILVDGKPIRPPA